MMKNYVRKYFLIATVLAAATLFAKKTFAQVDLLKNLQQQFATYRKDVLQEKIFVHTDKQDYLAGETIWFKVYYVDASLHQPLDLSKVVYVEILDRQQTPVLQTKVALKKGGGDGSIVLPVDVSSGHYSFRAYTAWMKNFDADFYFEKKISIVNTVTDMPVKATSDDAPAYDIQFFPEGGNLVADLKTKLAFRAVDQNGKGVPLNGVIVNQNNDTIMPFQPLAFGIGAFDFTPQKNSSYKAVISLPNNEQRTLDLPKVYEQGYVLTLTGSDRIEANVQANIAEGQSIYLFVHARNQILFAETATMKNGQAQFAINQKQLAEGISHFTLFDSRMQPVCERLFFKRPEKLQLQVNMPQREYRQREKVVLDISAKDGVGRTPPMADLSLAIYQVDSLRATSEEDIRSYLFLTSDLKGSIESPGYYFANETKETAVALDNLMLTHGWRRFKWEDILLNKKPVFRFSPELEGHIVSAKIVNTATNLPGTNVSAYLSIPGNQFHLYTAQSNVEGRVNFYAKSFFGPFELVGQAATSSNDTYRVDIETPFSENLSTRKLPVFHTSEISTGGLQTKSVNMQVQNIHTSGKTTLSLPQKIDTVAFYGFTPLHYKLDDYVRFPTMEEVLREYVREINVYRNNNRLSLALIRRYHTGLAEKKMPLVLIDGVPVLDDMNKVFRYDPLKVRELDIVNKDYFLGNRIFSGVVNFKTYEGRPEGLDLDTKATVLDYDGLQLKREFYAPVYDNENQLKSRLPDFRSLLYWSPEIILNETGSQTVNFYTSDLTGQYVGVLQALTADGKAGSTIFTINVKNK